MFRRPQPRTRGLEGSGPPNFTGGRGLEFGVGEITVLVRGSIDLISRRVFTIVWLLCFRGHPNDPPPPPLPVQCLCFFFGVYIVVVLCSSKAGVFDCSRGESRRKGSVLCCVGDWSRGGDGGGRVADDGALLYPHFCHTYQVHSIMRTTDGTAIRNELCAVSVKNSRRKKAEENRGQ